MNLPHKKAVAYVRISSMRQVDNESIDTQISTIQRYADTNDIEIVQWFEDIAKSGKNTERDGLQELLGYCMSNKNSIDHWIVYNMRRASRDIDSYTSKVRLVLKARGVTIRSATEPSVNDTKEGRFMENMLVAMGQLDNEGKAEVTVDNMRSLTMQGYWLNAPMLGYDMCKIKNDTGKLRPSLKPNKMSENVKIVLERFSQGDITKAELTRYAKDVGLRSRYGKVLSKDRIHKLLKQPTYAGYVSGRLTDHELVEGKHPALISPATFRKNQELLFGKNSRKGEQHSRINPDYPLKGTILCQSCEKPMYASAPRTGNGQSSPRYHCSRIECRGKVKSTKARKVHDDFEIALQQLRPSEGILKLYKEILIREANNQLGRLNKRLNNLREEQTVVDESRFKAIQSFTDGKISIDEKNLLIDRLDEQKLKLSSVLDEMEQQQAVRETDIEMAINQMENVSEQWALSDADIKLRFQNMLFPRGVVYDDKTGKFGTSEISPLYRYAPTKKDLPEPEKSFLVAQVHSNWNLILEELSRWLQLNREVTGLVYSTAAD